MSASCSRRPWRQPGAKAPLLSGLPLDLEERILQTGLRISVVTPDEDYLGIELSAANGQFAGATYIYSGCDELSALASLMVGFPSAVDDERNYEFGSTQPGHAGGFASLRFHCVDARGHAAVEVTIEADGERYASASAKFAFPVAAARAELEAGREVTALGVVVLPEASGVRAAREDGSEIVSHEAFWFAWSQFYPGTIVWPGP